MWAMVRRTVPNQECPLDCDCMMCRDKEEWTALVQMISLTEEQIQKLLFVRWGLGSPTMSLCMPDRYQRFTNEEQQPCCCQSK